MRKVRMARARRAASMGAGYAQGPTAALPTGVQRALKLPMAPMALRRYEARNGGAAAVGSGHGGTAYRAPVYGGAAYAVAVYRPWVAAPYYGAVVAGVALGSVIAATTPPPPPSPALCWFWSSPAHNQGYWDYCAR